MLTVLVVMFICAAMVTGLLLALLRFIAVVMGAATVTGVAEAELQIALLSRNMANTKSNVKALICRPTMPFKQIMNSPITYMTAYSLSSEGRWMDNA